MFDTLRYSLLLDGKSPYGPMRQAMVESVNGFGRVSTKTGVIKTRFTVAIHKASLSQYDALWRIHSALTGYGARVTRLDVCLDVTGPIPSKLIECRPKAVYLNDKTGKLETLYYGSRESPVLLRVYDKRAEILKRQRVDLGQDLTRYEFEFKRQTARDVYVYCLSHLRHGTDELELTHAIMSKFDRWGVVPVVCGPADLDLSKAKKIEVDVLGYYLRHRERFLAEMKHGELGQIMLDDIENRKDKVI